MRPIVADVAWSVSLLLRVYVCLLVTIVSSTKTTDQVEVPKTFKTMSNCSAVTVSLAMRKYIEYKPGLQLPPQPLGGLLPILLLGEQRHNGCEHFVMAAYRRVYDSRHLQADCQEPGSAPYGLPLPFLLGHAQTCRGRYFQSYPLGAE